MNIYFAEIIESSLDSWRAQCWQWDKMPNFADIVTIEESDRTIFGIVSNIQTGCIDQSRSVFTYQKTFEELQNEQPQIFEFLKTTFTCLVIGYIQNDKVYHTIADQPPKIHSFVKGVQIDDLKTFIENQTYLQVLFNHSNKTNNFDDLLITFINNLIKKKAITEQQINSFLEIYNLMTNDYRKLKLFVQRINY